jgi:hippurate hydrolase
MSQTLVLPHHDCALNASDRLRSDRLAQRCRSEFADLRPEEPFSALRARTLGDVPTLHLDDSSAITGMEYFPENVYLQDRARLRAGDGDVVASCTQADPVFERYCVDTLGLGRPEWLRVRPAGSALELAVGCWTDRQTRYRLVHLAKKRKLACIHPYLGSFHVWALAQLLSRAGGRRVTVLAPPPALTRRVNDKTWFTGLVRRLLGEDCIPESYQVFNYATLAHVIQHNLLDSPHIVIKLPDSAGGKGNLLLETLEFHDASVGAIRARLREALHELHWSGDSRLLVSCWEEPVLCSPSAQLWLPPSESGREVAIEGLFNQVISGGRGDFLGSAPATFPDRVEAEIARSCLALARVFQQLGYVGRCSFDMLLTGKDLDSCQLKFIECNGRWGGTSGPMSLMNRWFDDWAGQPYATSVCEMPGLESLAFEDLLQAFDADLFDAGSRTGWLAFLDAAGLPHSRINLLALGDDVGQARERVGLEVPAKLRELVAAHGGGSVTLGGAQDQVPESSVRPVRPPSLAQPLAGSGTLADRLDSSLRKRIQELRRWFHQHPELSFRERDTAGRIMQELDEIGVPHDYAGVGHAVIAQVAGNRPAAPAIALRADMDALPGEETTGAPYASQNKGVMHACGHCAHMAILLGAAHLLQSNPPPGPVRLVFQPAEESGGGARVAIADGALENVSAIFAGHVTHEYETGRIMVRDGPVTAQSDGFTIKVSGKGGHGARPHEAIDAVVIAGFLIIALQTLVSRETNPLHPSVITVGSIQAGSAGNVIAENAVLSGTIRTCLGGVREHLHHGMRRMVSAAAELHNAHIEIEIREGYPPVHNEPECTAIARQAAVDVVGSSAVVASEHPSMGSEDFSFYLQERPGCFVRFGARKPDWEPIPLHSPAFDIDENALAIGACYFDRLARRAHRQLHHFRAAA